ncbi:MAG: glycosyltransferase [Bacteroidales bacterium]|nr:glycosyltransferase [Bacteroidales bacterium]
MLSIPIVVVAYNRPHALGRLLGSLSNATYPCMVKLIISIDGGADEQVRIMAKEYDWEHGEKEIIQFKRNIGLRKHIIECGNLTKQHDAVIILEDDLYVSPGFYNYILSSYNYYNDDPQIAGISLYSHHFNETAKLPFIPLSDESDVFFMQIPSSWGQCWTKKQWQKFSKWYKKNKRKKITPSDGVPPDIIKWPDSSWKKYYCKYMVQENNYFVYPRRSYTTNFGDPGTHFEGKLVFLQLPLQLGNRNLIYKELKTSDSVYDSYCEIIPDRLNKFVPELSEYNFTVDLYNTKDKNEIDTPYLLTTKFSTDPIMKFGKELKPHEYNIIVGIKGDDISLALTKKCIHANQKLFLLKEELLYHYHLREYHLKYNK